MGGNVIKVEALSKQYRIGLIGRRTLREDASAWIRGLRRKKDTVGCAKAENGSRKHQGTIWALRDVSFTVRQGEVVGIVGRNGAGKSTLLKIMSRITAPTTGEVKLKGRLASLLEVGTGFHPELTGRENIFLNGSILGLRRWEIDRRLAEIVDFSGVEDYIDTPVKRYSSGMHVRLAFAVAAHLESDILLIDEVLAVGDAEFQRKCLGKMSQAAHDGRTVLFVSHNMAAVESLCERGILIDHGEIRAQGDVPGVLAHYYESFQVDRPTAPSQGQVPGSAFEVEGVELIANGVSGIDLVALGDGLEICVNLSVSSPVRKVYFGLTVIDEFDSVVAAFHGKELGLFIAEELFGPTQLRVEIPHLLLMPHRYYLRFVAVDEGGETLQVVPRAAEFTVLPRDFSGHGHQFSRGHGTTLIPFRMAITGADGKSWTGEALAPTRNGAG